MNDIEIALIGSASLRADLHARLARNGRSPKIYALARGARDVPGTQILSGSFLDANKVETVVRAAKLIVYAPRDWRAWIPGWFERGLRYGLLAAGWAGARTLIVAPPAIPAGAWGRLFKPWQAHIAHRVEELLRRQPPGVDWHLHPDLESACAVPASAIAVSAPRHLRCVSSSTTYDKPVRPPGSVQSADVRTSG
jgi:hypothetical protein